MKKNLILTTIAALAAMMTFTACTNEEEIAKDNIANFEPMNFKIGLGDMAVTRSATNANSSQENNAVTNATTIDEKWAASQQIGIWTTDANTTTGTKVYNVIADDAGIGSAIVGIEASSSASNGKFYWQSSSDAKVVKVFSYGETSGITAASGALSIPAFTVAADQTATPNHEFLYNVGTLKYVSGNAAKTINLGHQLALLEITINSDKNASDLELTIGSSTHPVVTVGTFVEPSYSVQSSDDMTTQRYGHWTPGATTGVIYPRCVQATTGSDGSYTTVYRAVVIPQNFNGTDMFKIHYDGADYIYQGTTANDNLGYDAEAEPVLNGAGNKYTYTITLQTKAMEVSTAVISAWNTSAKGGVNADFQ